MYVGSELSGSSFLKRLIFSRESRVAINITRTIDARELAMNAVAARKNNVSTLPSRALAPVANCKALIADRLNKTAQRLGNPLRDACHHHLSSNGKMLRGQLAVRAASVIGAQLSEAVEWATAVELLHNATLVHDDICDRDETRRGQASVAHRYGTQIALCLGDALISESFAAARRYSDRQETLDALNLAINELAEGQASEFSCAHYPSVDQCFEIAVKKTGPLFTLPVCGALQLGGVASATDDVRAYLNACAIAFQAMNDLSNFDVNPVYNTPSSDFARLRPNIAISLFVDSLDATTRHDFDTLHSILKRPSHRTAHSARLMEQFWNMFSGSVALRSALALTKIKVEAADQLFARLDPQTADVVSPLHSWLLATSAGTTLIH